MGRLTFLRCVKLRVRSKKGGQDIEQAANTTALSDVVGCSKADKLGQSQQNPHDDPGPRPNTEQGRPFTHDRTQNASPCVTEPPQSPASSTGSRSTLWSSAYEALQQKKPPLVDRYEEIVFKEFEKQDPSATGMQGLVQQHDGQHPNENQINTNPSNRYDRLKIITERGLQRAKDKRIKYTIFGHEFNLRKQADNATQCMLKMKGVIDQAVKVYPEASIAWAGVCVLLPIFRNPHAATEANRNGLSYVISRLEYYVELERLLRVDELKSKLNGEFHRHIVDLYQLIIEFQIETVLQFYRNWVAQLARDATRSNDWEGMILKIQKQEKIIQKELGTLQRFDAIKTLNLIYDEAQQNHEEMKSLMEDVLNVLKNQLDLLKQVVALWSNADIH
ncbi:hypothetical protein AAL_01456 [Moelleriella libera RCEF 2490]|uniref:NWD NACHT-NTPase N-terminal domain-containing protein n=1 Tax=Moelleriella libera RCEF 2490 TaxID=1081109 RepID=A0A166U6P5_9HYPO|nr:hypothetical protein AAL_01456 [Moelleriella libera RCEF 2490]